MKRHLLVLLFLLSATLLHAGNTVYLFSYFVDNSRDGLHLAYSRDGLTWTALNGGNSFLIPTVGKDRLMRDPSICQAPDGTFHLVWTSSWTDRIIGYASSPDLIHWSEQQALPVMMHEPEAHNCWAPELFYDEPSETYYIFWATTIPGRHKEVPVIESEKGLNHRIYYVTTKDFQTYSETKMFFNPDFSVIDATIVRDTVENDLIMVVKNENSLPAEKNLRITRAKHIEDGFPTDVSPSITGDYWCEGPAPLFVGDDLYIYFDKYRNHEFGAVCSHDHGKTWEDVSDQVSFPVGIRHGTAFAVDESVLDALLQLHDYNPIIPDHIADASVSKFGDTYYLYGTTDLDAGLSRAGTPVVWTSKDFVNWTFEGSHIEGFDWTEGHPYTNDKGEEKTGYFRYWAPGKVVEKDGLYYLYTTFVKPDGDARTYVMKADKPEGPFRFAASTDAANPLDGFEASCIAPDIDGEPFIDDDGTPYLYWRRRMAARMTPDLQHLEGDTIQMQTARQGYSEGPLLFKRKGIYYYVYTLGGNQNYVYAYMMSRESPLTGFEKPEGNDIFLFSSIATDVWGPGHGNVFYDEAADDYIFIYLEYGDGGTTRRVYANRMDFNPDGTIKTMVPDAHGVGYLAPATETRANLALQATFTASSTMEPRAAKVKIETRPNEPLPEKASEVSVERKHAYLPAYAGDGRNATCWMAGKEDTTPWIVADLQAPTDVAECRLAFVHPTEGHAWHLEKSLDGEAWQPCDAQTEIVARSPHTARVGDKVRYLRLSIDQGAAGLWEWAIY
ncbi:MAG: family 43 glycosylhydrolase [Prevotellaceae bacterium]|nr:family 43 glycosylhydrolase [Prevotellaceae bacterium]